MRKRARATTFAEARSKALSCRDKALWPETDRERCIKRARHWAGEARRLYRQAMDETGNVMAGKQSQRKGRNAELADLRAWRQNGIKTVDKRNLEAAGVETGADYKVLTEPPLLVQRKHRKALSIPQAWKEVSQAAKGTTSIPVVHATWHRGPDVAVLEWNEFMALVVALCEAK